MNILFSNRIMLASQQRLKPGNDQERVRRIGGRPLEDELKEVV